MDSKKKRPFSLTLQIDNTTYDDDIPVASSKAIPVASPEDIPDALTEDIPDALTEDIPDASPDDNPDDNPDASIEDIQKNTKLCKDIRNKLNDTLNLTNPSCFIKRLLRKDLTKLNNGEFGIVYDFNTTSIYKISNTFLKIYKDLSKCRHQIDKKINDLLTITLNIEETTRIISDKVSRLANKHFYNIPLIVNLCNDPTTEQIRNKEDEIRNFPVIEYFIEKINGITLYKFVETKTFNAADDDATLNNFDIYNQNDIINIFIQLLYLTYLLNINGIIHNDIHRQNIMIVNNTDFQNIELHDLIIDEHKIDIILTKCKFKIVIIDFEISLLVRNKFPVDFAQVIYLFCDDTKTQNHIPNIEFYDKIIYEYFPDVINSITGGLRLYGDSTIEKIPDMTSNIAKKLFCIFKDIDSYNKLKNKNTTIIVTKSSLTYTELQKKYIKYKSKYIKKNKIY
jgi:hypothetical protein